MSHAQRRWSASVAAWGCAPWGRGRAARAGRGLLVCPLLGSAPAARARPGSCLLTCRTFSDHPAPIVQDNGRTWRAATGRASTPFYKTAIASTLSGGRSPLCPCGGLGPPPTSNNLPSGPQLPDNRRCAVSVTHAALLIMRPGHGRPLPWRAISDGAAVSSLPPRPPRRPVPHRPYRAYLQIRNCELNFLRCEVNFAWNSQHLSKYEVLFCGAAVFLKLQDCKEHLRFCVVLCGFGSF